MENVFRMSLFRLTQWNQTSLLRLCYVLLIFFCETYLWNSWKKSQCLETLYMELQIVMQNCCFELKIYLLYPQNRIRLLFVTSVNLTFISNVRKLNIIYDIGLTDVYRVPFSSRTHEPSSQEHSSEPPFLKGGLEFLKIN